ncbi:MAG: hypothetical protein Q9202_003009 [Teloschistes flavicans]
MSAQVWPPISHDQLIKEEEDSLAAELEWLLESLQEALSSLKSGLEECIALLTRQEPGTTLALSTLRSETVKGFVTRVALDIIDVSAYTGDPKNGSFISGQLRLLADTIDEAKAVMKGGEDVVGGKWWEDDCAGDDMRGKKVSGKYTLTMRHE